MNSALSRHDRGPAGLCLLTVALVVGTILATFGPGVAEAWPLSSAPRYECYCRNCYEGHFVCRNRNYSCNCAVCSCYNDVVQLAADTHTPRDKDAYMEALLQHFYGRRSLRNDVRRWVIRTKNFN